MIDARAFLDAQSHEVFSAADDVASRVRAQVPAAEHFSDALIDALRGAGFDDLSMLDAAGAGLAAAAVLAVARHSAEAAWWMVRQDALRRALDDIADGVDGFGLGIGPASTDEGGPGSPAVLVRVGYWREARGPIALLGRDGVRVVDQTEARLRPVGTTGLTGFSTFHARIDSVPGVRDLDPQALAGARDTLSAGGAVVAVGVALDSLSRAQRYASERSQFGSPLSALESVSGRLRHGEETVAWLLETAARPAALASPAGHVDRVVEGALDVVTVALQVHGGYGYMEEFGIEAKLRDLLTLRAECSGLHS